MAVKYSAKVIVGAHFSAFTKEQQDSIATRGTLSANCTIELDDASPYLDSAMEDRFWGFAVPSYVGFDPSGTLSSDFASNVTYQFDKLVMLGVKPEILSMSAVVDISSKQELVSSN